MRFIIGMGVLALLALFAVADGPPAAERLPGVEPLPGFGPAAGGLPGFGPAAGGPLSRPQGPPAGNVSVRTRDSFQVLHNPALRKFGDRFFLVGSPVNDNGAVSGGLKTWIALSEITQMSERMSEPEKAEPER
jgi:hypothetical protein